MNSCSDNLSSTKIVPENAQFCHNCCRYQEMAEEIENLQSIISSMSHEYNLERKAMQSEIIHLFHETEKSKYESDSRNSMIAMKNHLLEETLTQRNK